jgi:hypothetical protein
MTDAREVLLKLQNPDGGWGYYPGRKSCLEPTAWSLIALQEGPAVERGWKLLRGWQREDGGWRVSAQVDESSWATSLVVLLHGFRSDFGDSCRRGVRWLVGQRGAGESLLARVQRVVTRKKAVDQDISLEAWPWRAGNAAWVEPTSYAMLALRAAGLKVEPQQARERLAQGEKMLLNRRCKDGGWNYGNRRVLETDLESFPETTAAALLALHNGIQDAPLDASFQQARKVWERTPTPLASAMLRTAFRVWEKPFEEPPVPPAGHSTEVTTLAFEAIGQENGAWRRFTGLGRA